MNKVTKQRFIFAKDIIEILGVKETKAYEIIKQLNKELEAKGFYTQRGRVSAKYFEERFYLQNE